MTVSNSYNFTMTRDDIINEAFRLAAIIDQESTPTTTEYANATQSLNIIMKRLMSRGVKLWTYDTIILFPSLGKNTYSISSSGDRACLESDFVETILDSAVASGASSFDLLDASGITINDEIGILKNQVVEWHTVSGVSLNTVTISASLSKDYDGGSVVFSYTSKPPKPLRVSSVTTRISSTSTFTSDSIVVPISQREYAELYVKDLVGNPNQYFFKPRIDDSQIYFFPQPQDEGNYIKIVIEKSFDDFDSSTDTAPTPNEYYDIIIYSLAERLAFQFGFTERSATLKVRLDELIKQNELWDNQNASITFGFTDNWSNISGWGSY